MARPRAASVELLRDEVAVTGDPTAGNVELRVGTGRWRALKLLELAERGFAPKKFAISLWLATRSRATIAIAVASSAQSAKRW